MDDQQIEKLYGHLPYYNTRLVWFYRDYIEKLLFDANHYKISEDEKTQLRPIVVLRAAMLSFQEGSELYDRCSKKISSKQLHEFVHYIFQTALEKARYKYIQSNITPEADLLHITNDT